jgi:hypothetical protein
MCFEKSLASLKANALPLNKIRDGDIHCFASQSLSTAILLICHKELVEELRFALKMIAYIPLF